MKLTLVLLFVTTVQCLGSAEAKRLEIGGKDTGILLYPFMAAIELAKKLIGNGAIIAQRYVLTSASAVLEPHYSLYKVQVGADTFQGTGDWYEVLTIYKHPEFIGWDYNIALIHLKDRIAFGDTVQSIPIADTFTNNLEVLMLSYGTNEDNTMHLREAICTISTGEDCVKFLTGGLSKDIVLQGHGFCVHGTPGTEQGQWPTDAGAPIVAAGKLYGVFAFTEDEGRVNVGSVGTSVSSFLEWIYETMGV
uniref:Peptidase S1 domain-containing protein n=1 Tax=Anopheles christyi TaxID=43041 RepID=A0A182K3Q6_9DIPT